MYYMCTIEQKKKCKQLQDLLLYPCKQYKYMFNVMYFE